jgi:Virulence-associated protein E
VPLGKRDKRRGGGRQTAGDGGGPNWPDTTQHGAPKRTCANARVAIEALGVRCRYDVFHDRVVIDGSQVHVSGPNVDHACHMLRVETHRRFAFDAGKDHTHDALIQLALVNRFDPVLEYLDGLRWDGVSRLDAWLIKYLSADDTALNRAIGRLMLIAGVRRVRQPGCKFDTIPVFEGPEGTHKSSMIGLLAGLPENFSDQSILGLSDQKQQEQLRGKWLYEIAELGGMKRADVDHVKAFASRTHDRGRPAYVRGVVDQPRRCIMLGTTNNETYLKSQNGNRRFWPVKTGQIDIEALRCHRDQLWAEAATAERTGLSLVLPRELRGAAGVEQDRRLEHDPWIDILRGVEGQTFLCADGRPAEQRISSRELLVRHLGIARGKISTADGQRLKTVMVKLGWIYCETALRFGRDELGEEIQGRGYRRPAPQ